MEPSESTDVDRQDIKKDIKLSKVIKTDSLIIHYSLPSKGLLSQHSPEKGGKTRRVSYNPSHFIRCHHGTGMRKQPADAKIQVWDAAFEPDNRYPKKTTNNLATCGGNSICVTDIITGKVLMKHIHNDKREAIYSICWTLIAHEDGCKKSVLVSGSLKGEICMFYPEQDVCFYIW